MEKNNRIRIIVYGYDVASVEEATEIVSNKSLQLKLTFSVIPLPVEKNTRTVPISPHKHKNSQETFVKKTHRRLIEVTNASSSALEALEKLHTPATTRLKAKSFF